VTVTVLLVDDDDLMRAGLRSVLSTDEGIDVVGEAGDGRAAVERARALQPDVALLDVQMPLLDGIAATPLVLACSPRTKIVMLTTFDHDDYIFGGLRAGASGFLLKRTRPEDLIAAIHTVASGDSLLSPSVTRRVIEEIARRPAHRGPELRQTVALLTAREREVFGLIAQGCSNAEIAAELYVEESTVKSHVKRILQKLGVRDRVHAVIVAYESGSLLG
jgi:DNA-binding NarL/FixJ family response regulator